MKPEKESHNLEHHWTRSAVVYQIYPRSFKDSNGDGIGDLRGIIQKLDYLNDGTERSLGINAIWINPIYPSPMKDFGYDVSDYYSIDPLFGTMADFETLVSYAHARTIKILMDFVPNHTSSQHPWFLESRSSRMNKKRDWYIWRDPKPDGNPPNNWLSVFGGPAWTFDATTGQYYLHSFLKDQPDLNWRTIEVREEMEHVLRFWLQKGVDGFRTDSISYLIKDDGFRDDPPNPNYIAGRSNPYDALLHIYSQGRPELLSAANTLCKVLDAYPHAFMVSEAYLGIPKMVELYRACDNNLHAPFNFNLITLPWNGESFKTFIDEFDAHLRPDDCPNYVFGNHDRSRVATRLGQKRARIAAVLQCTLRGMPFIYYGEEIGMEDLPVKEETGLDPWGKNVPGFNLGRDPERTPMQWDDTLHAGFSTSTPWLPLANNFRTINVARESLNPRSMLTLYRTLIHIRTHTPALLNGSYHSLPLQGGKDIFSFIRIYKKEGILIMINFSDTSHVVSFSEDVLRGFLNTGCRVLCNTECNDAKKYMNIDTLTLRPYEAYVLALPSK
ncbi:MAG: alpha-amylase [Patescibacteria group bacterium]|nr:alpha-amylase [Patescibacteria group bacterium]MDE2438860.1 alpha-amylase [Patescibacteria group bacterium]